MLVQQLSSLVSVSVLAQFGEVLVDYVAQWSGPNNLDKNLLLANLLLAWQEVK